MSSHDSRVNNSRYKACLCIQREPRRTAAPGQLWLKPGRTLTILWVCTLTVRDTNKIMPAGIVRAILSSENYKTEMPRGKFPSGPFWFTTSNLAAWRPAELQVLQHPTHSACSTFKQQQNIFTHELTKRPLANRPKTQKEKKT